MKLNPNTVKTTSLAYLGDAVYEVRIREMLLMRMHVNVDKMHKAAVKYVSAFGQAKAIKEMMAGFLTEEEVALVKRARNHRTTSRSRAADPKTYKLATGFEALMGYLHITGNIERLEEVFEEAVRIIEGDENE